MPGGHDDTLRSVFRWERIEPTGKARGSEAMRRSSRRSGLLLGIAMGIVVCVLTAASSAVAAAYSRPARMVGREPPTRNSSAGPLATHTSSRVSRWLLEAGVRDPHHTGILAGGTLSIDEHKRSAMHGRSRRAYACRWLRHAARGRLRHVLLEGPYRVGLRRLEVRRWRSRRSQRRGASLRFSASLPAASLVERAALGPAGGTLPRNLRAPRDSSVHPEDVPIYGFSAAPPGKFPGSDQAAGFNTAQGPLADHLAG